MNDLSIIFPSYKEGENLSILVPTLKKYLDSFDIRYQIIVIDSIEKMDDTEEICKSLNVEYYKRENGNTYGDAIRTGITKIQYGKTIIMDADGSHDPKYIQEMLLNSEDYDMVIGSRYIKNGKTQNNFILVFMSLAVNIMYRMFLRIKVKDVSNSFRLYDSKMLKGLELECNNFDIVEEILIKITLKYPKIKIKEVAIEFKKRVHGESKRKLLKFVVSYLITIRRLLKIKKEYIELNKEQGLEKFYE